MNVQDTKFKVCSVCKIKVSLAYGNIDGRQWFCVGCLIKYPLLADVGLVELYYRFSTPYYGFPQLTKSTRQQMHLEPKQFKRRKDLKRKIKGE